MRRRLVSADQARRTTRQHQKPCGDCPWARASLPGWLGGVEPGTWLKAAHGEERIACHTLVPQQCAGSAIYRGNVSKLPRDPDVLRLPPDRARVFATPHEFLGHHIDQPTRRRGQ